MSRFIVYVLVHIKWWVGCDNFFSKELEEFLNHNSEHTGILRLCSCSWLPQLHYTILSHSPSDTLRPGAKSLMFWVISKRVASGWIITRLTLYFFSISWRKIPQDSHSSFGVIPITWKFSKCVANFLYMSVEREIFSVVNNLKVLLCFN